MASPARARSATTASPAYATRLGGALLGVLSEDRSLRDVLAEGIERVTDQHRDTCRTSPTRSARSRQWRCSGSPAGPSSTWSRRRGRAGRPGLRRSVVAHDPREVVIARSFEERLKDARGRRRVPAAVHGVAGPAEQPWRILGRQGRPPVVDEAVTGECTPTT
ncbi:hypothetical protein V2I01_41110 [Micromonospora sp. BRA006-A]|nr:hypothetical protein [Micromonospora sp. BRA006-A]